MLKSVKGKVIAGTVAVGLLSGVTVAFGATDAGKNLKSWYDGQFKQSSDLVAQKVAGYAEGKVEGLAIEYEGLKDNTTDKLNTRGEFVTGTTNKGIDARASEHIDAIKDQKQAIESHLEGQFKALSNFAKGLINETGDKALAYATEDLEKHAGTVGEEEIGKMKESVAETTAQAVSDLEETIKYAKEDLQAQLDKNADLTIEEIIGMIDAKIVELRDKITKMNDKLIADQDKLITMNAKTLLLAAQKELDDIVAGMNK